MSSVSSIGTPYNIAEFTALIQKIVGTGILDNEGSNFDEISLNIEGDSIRLRILFYGNEKEPFDRLKKVRRVIGGRWDKNYGYYMEFTRDYFGGTIELATYRENACTRKVTGVEEIPERVIPERIEKAHTKEIVEWVCDE